MCMHRFNDNGGPKFGFLTRFPISIHIGQTEYFFDQEDQYNSAFREQAEIFTDGNGRKLNFQLT